MELTDFLLARIAEAEATARALGAFHWYPREDGLWEVAIGTGPDDDRAVVVADELSEPTAQHIAYWDPARILVECEAKRRIVEADARRQSHTDEVASARIAFIGDGAVEVNGERMPVTDFDRRYTVPAEPSEHVRLLALPYADHPDYLEEWRP